MTWKTSEKKNETETQNTVEGYSNRLEQVEDKISELEDKIESKGKTEKLLVITQDLQKEYARTHRLHQKTKPENHGH
jgi:Mg2+ and Co2+ transporter CorA